MTKQTPLIDEHRRLGGKLTEFAGYELPLQYTGVTHEHHAVRRQAGLFDVSHMGRFFVKGDAAVAWVNGLITNDLESVNDGRALYTCACNEQGTILDDLIVYRLEPSLVLVVCNAGNHDKIGAHLRARVAAGIELDDATDRTALLALQGPQALAILSALGSGIGSGIADIEHNLPSFGVVRTEVGGTPCLVARTGYTGEDGVELSPSAGDAVKLWKALLETGQSFGLEPVGLAARDTLRLEARLSLYGHEIDETTHPFEAGLGWTVKLGKRDFLGKNALAAVNGSPLPRRLVGFVMLGRGVARHGYPLLDQTGQSVGLCTSGAPSPTLGQNIGLGYLPADLVTIGSQFQVDCRGRKVGAKVVKTPFYKRQTAG